MHDPMILAWEIKYPWPGKYNTFLKRRMRSSFITFWHVDPETDGTDDSCGWHSPPLTKDQLEKIKEVMTLCLGNHSLFKPGIIDAAAYENGTSNRIRSCLLNTTREQALYYAFAMIKRMVFNKRNKLTSDETDALLSITYNPHDNLLPPYDEVSRDDIEMWLWPIARTLACLYRPRWKHPRYHFWHYKVQIHPVQKIKRWLFTRCAICGKRFKYGESGVTSQWHSTGPMWFKSEDLRHMKCDGGCDDSHASI